MTSIEKIKAFLEANKNRSRGNFPPIDYLEDFAKLMYNESKYMYAHGTDFGLSDRVISLKMALYFYISDLGTVLKNDHKGRLKSYRSKWGAQKGILEAMRYKFISLYKDIEISKMGAV